MLSKEEIRELKKTHQDLEKRMEKIGIRQRLAIVKLSKQLKLLMAEIESAQEKEKSTWNPAVSTRVKMAKRGVELSKDLVYFERWAAGESGKGNISEDTGKKLALIARLAREGKMEAAKKEFAYFEEIIELNERHEKAEEGIKENSRVLRKEQLRLEKILTDISELENETIDLEKVRSYEELLKNLEMLKKSREAYLHSLLSRPIAELICEMEKHSLKEHCPSFPEKEEMAGLQQFFSDYPSFGKYDVGQLCECLGYNEKKLSYLCPETSRFRRIVAGNAGFFESIRSLGQSGFLAVDGWNEKTLDFYSGMGEREKKIVEEIRRLGKDRRSYEEEYEKSRQLQKRKEELSKYPRKELEGERECIRRLIELLDSRNPDQKTLESGNRKTEKCTEKQGLLSAIGSFFRKLE